MEYCSQCGTQMTCPHCRGQNAGPPSVFTLAANIPRSIRDRLNQYTIDGVYESSQDVRQRLDLKWWGIYPVPNEDVVVLFGNASSGGTVDANPYTNYHYKPLDLYIYMGEGKQGDQQLSEGNRALVDAMESDTVVHLFWSEYRGYHRYVGPVDILYYDILKQEGTGRSVFAFFLKPKR